MIAQQTMQSSYSATAAALDVRYGRATGRALKALVAIISSGSSSISAAAQAGFASAPGQHNNAAGTEYEHYRHAASAINGGWSRSADQLYRQC
ncbi:MAG: hypothetical protein WA792_03510, partial [Pseudolabrys sp.]